MANLNLDELERLAKAVVDAKTGLDALANIRPFSQAANPTIILALFARVRRLEEVVGRSYMWSDDVRGIGKCLECGMRWELSQGERHEPDCIVLTLPKVEP